MRKARQNGSPASEMRTEYKLDYAQARLNRFAARMRGDVVAVVLEPDVAEVFNSSEAVDQLLRSVISAVPRSGKRSVARKPRRKVSQLAHPKKSVS